MNVCFHLLVDELRPHSIFKTIILSILFLDKSPILLALCLHQEHLLQQRILLIQISNTHRSLGLTLALLTPVVGIPCHSQ